MRTTWTIVALLAAGACSSSERMASWSPVSETQLDANGRAKLERAQAARDELFTRLSGELGAALKSGDAASAITVCAERAPLIAGEVAAARGVRIGRTSWKLRNPANTAPAWATGLLADHPADPRYASSPDGALGVTLPIRVLGACLRCHGNETALDAGVSAALAARYPEDRATGFAEGDLRGWFWVEVP